MSSILTNAASLSALQSLEMTQSALATTQGQVSTGLKVASAADNAAYWSIATQLKSDSGVIGASNDALNQSQAVLSTANSAINSIISTINSITTALTQATNPGADVGNINTSLASLGKQLSDAVKGASFNGLNLLDGSVGVSSPLNFVACFTASSTGGTFNTISFSAQSLTGAGGVASTSTQPNITDATTITQLNALADNHTGTLSYGQNVVDKTTDATNHTFTVASQALNGTVTTTKYTGLDANGNVTTAGAAVAFGVSVTTTPPAGLLTQGGNDLTNLTTSAATAGAQLNSVEAALSAVTNYAAVIGSTQNRMTSADTLNKAITTNYATGVSALIDADMNQASTRLQALRTQQQLGIQSLSIANQSSQLILKLFQ
jgi:flagellin